MMKKYVVMFGLSLFLAACASTGSNSGTQSARENIDAARDGVQAAREGTYLLREIKSLFNGY